MRLHASRRTFLTMAAAGMAALATRSPALQAQTSSKYKRISLSDPALPKSALESYKKAVRAMLALPPHDPRNWYRIALAHTLDCPHGNWWFLVWHRAFLGWFEKICRELSGDPSFALPFWDWTALPRIPPALFDDVLNPNHQLFISDVRQFKSKFEETIKNADYWTPGAERYRQLLQRGLRTPDDLWFDIEKNPEGKFFFDQPSARGLTYDQPDLRVTDGTQLAVSLPMILDALSPRDFITFGSPRTLTHVSYPVGFGVLESQPHNMVHNCVGGRGDQSRIPAGFMYEFMSPVDPIFYLHHANIDRLWDLWTRKQLRRKYPHLPDGYQRPADQRAGTDYAAWARESFLHFVDADGKPAAKVKAGDYAEIGDFNYEYGPGSGDEILVGTLATDGAKVGKPTALSARVLQGKVGAGQIGKALIRLTRLQLQGVAGEGVLLVKLKLQLERHARFKVVEGEADAASVEPGSPRYIATLAMFGTHKHSKDPITFIVPITRQVRQQLRMRGISPETATIHLQVVSLESHVSPAHSHADRQDARVLSVTVETH